MRLWVKSNEYQIGPTSPLSVGGGVFEFGFSFSSATFSGPGSLADESCSAVRVFARVCALAAPPAKAAVANVEPIPIMLLLEKPWKGLGSWPSLIMLPPLSEGRLLVEPLLRQ